MPAHRMKNLKRMVSRLREKWLPGCGKSPSAEVLEFGGLTMGTTYGIVLHGLPAGTRIEVLKDAVHGAVHDIDRRMSTHRKDSELSRFNAHRSREPFTVSAGTAEVFRISGRVSEASGGAFDITVGPLVNAWGFGPERFSPVPDDATIAALREKVGWHLVEVRDDNTLVKKHPDLLCDLSAVAKGYGVDKAAEALDQLGADHYLVEVGGELRTKGVNPHGRPWQLAIERPGDGEQQAQVVVGLSGLSLATSGDYRIFRVSDGKRLSHEIDPRSGCPVKDSVASASVIHPSCAWADAYATALMVLGPEEGIAFAEKNRLAAYLIERKATGEFAGRQTKAFGQYSSGG